MKTRALALLASVAGMFRQGIDAPTPREPAPTSTPENWLPRPNGPRSRCYRPRSTPQWRRTAMPLGHDAARLREAQAKRDRKNATRLALAVRADVTARGVLGETWARNLYERATGRKAAA